MDNNHHDLRRRQERAQVVYNTMLSRIIEYTPCGTMRIEDAQYLARTAQTLAFDASDTD